MLTDLPFIGKEYAIFFEIFIEEFPTTHEWESVLLLTKTTCNRQIPRYPGIWLKKGHETYSEFHITQDMNGTPNDAKNIAVPATNKWIKVEVSQTKIGEKVRFLLLHCNKFFLQYMFEAWIDGEKRISKENKTPQKREGGIKVCAGHMEPPVLGKMANFFITTK